MGLADRFSEYARAFEQSYADGDWKRLETYFREDATYRTYYGADLEAHGREAVLEQFRSDVEAFDRKFDARHLEFLDGPTEQGDRVVTQWKLTYQKADVPDLVLEGTETATYRGDRICLLVGEYALGTFGEFGAWLDKYGGFLRDS